MTDINKAPKLEPVHADKPQKFFDIEGKSMEEIVDTVQCALQHIEDPHNLNIILQIRSQLLAKFKPINDLIETIETGVKAADLPGGDYGFMARLVVSYAKKTTINDKLVFEQLKKLKLNPLDYAKVDTTNPVVKDVVAKTPGLSTVDPYGTKRFSFK